MDSLIGGSVVLHPLAKGRETVRKISNSQPVWPVDMSCNVIMAR